jgi:hypothetical protein
MADVDTSEAPSAELAPVRKRSERASVAELVDMILDKGIVIDAWTSVPVLGLDLLAVEARLVVVSVATYLRYAETMCISASGRPAQAPAQVVEVPQARGAGPGPDGRTDRLHSEPKPAPLFGSDPPVHLSRPPSSPAHSVAHSSRLLAGTQSTTR